MKKFKVMFVILCAGVVIGLVSFRSVKAQSAQQPYVLQITNAGAYSFRSIPRRQPLSETTWVRRSPPRARL